MVAKKQEMKTIYLNSRVYDELKKRKLKTGVPMVVQLERLLFG
jgi:hypothetical protein